MEILQEYFPDLSEKQLNQFQMLEPLYTAWNSKVNLVSRKDIEHLVTRHILHSVSIGMYFQFRPGTTIMDLGTGGGFPGIPLAILFPECRFVLVDSIRKKIKVVEDVIEQLGLENCGAKWSRAEELKVKVDFVVTRAVARMKMLQNWSGKLIKKTSVNSFQNGIIALKGGDVREEIKECRRAHEIFDLNELFEDDFFETKKIIYLTN